ncbi:DUF1254 domain-containing protein [Pseudomonas sp. NY15181]|uniref:DUF1254 domain-containing protein n=1 Tax=Pseudomonas sp. NY15181 TaxID=3400349 RepID=UPI003A84607B
MHSYPTRFFAAGVALLAAGFAWGSQPTPEEARAIAREAYVYGFPLVDNYRIQYTYFQDRSNPEFKAPWNRLHNEARLYTPADTAIQTPNADTPYSQLGADLRSEPLVLSVPEVEAQRYYSLQFVDAYTYNFAYVGSRATGNGAARYLLAGPDWKGPTPAGIAQVIRSDTQFAFVFYRTQLFNPQDMEGVRKVQAGFKVEPLSAYLGQVAPQPAPALNFIKPLSAEQERKSPEFFDVLNFVLTYCPTLPSEKELMARFARLNIGPGKTFDFQALTPELREAVQAGMADAWSQSMAGFERLRNAGKVSSGDVFGTREHLAGNYLYRMAAAVGGIYGNSAEEALYASYNQDAGQQKLDGSHRYVLRFAKDQLPPVHSFWSLTPYTLPERALVANPLQRYLVNSPMLPDMQRDADGGLTLYLQNASPGGEREHNWIPVPKGPFLLAMRFYWPKQELISGSWQRPALQRVE